MITTYFLNLVAGNIYRTKTSPAIPTGLWIGLSTTTPNIDGTNVTEPSSSGGYARVKLTSLSEPSNGVVTNPNAIVFNKSTTDWGVLSHYVIYDAQSGGNLLGFSHLLYNQAPVQRTAEPGTIFTIDSGDLRLSVENKSE